MFWLSHHTPEEWHRCYQVGPIRFCARCLGVYPTMLIGIVALFVFRAPLDSPLDLPVVLGIQVDLVEHENSRHGMSADLIEDFLGDGALARESWIGSVDDMKEQRRFEGLV